MSRVLISPKPVDRNGARVPSVTFSVHADGAWYSGAPGSYSIPDAALVPAAVNLYSSATATTAVTSVVSDADGNITPFYVDSAESLVVVGVSSVGVHIEPLTSGIVSTAVQVNTVHTYPWALSAKASTTVDNPDFLLDLSEINAGDVVVFLSYFEPSIYPDGLAHGGSSYERVDVAAPSTSYGQYLPINATAHLENRMQAVDIYQWGVIGAILPFNGALGFVNNPVEHAAHDTPKLQEFYDYIAVNNVGSAHRQFEGYTNATIFVTGDTTNYFSTKRVTGDFSVLGLVAMDHVIVYENVLKVLWDRDRVFGRGAYTLNDRVVQEGILYLNCFASEWSSTDARYFKFRGMHVRALSADVGNNIAMKVGIVQISDCGSSCKSTSASASIAELSTAFTNATTATGFNGSIAQRTVITIAAGLPENIHENAIVDIDDEPYIVRAFDATNNTVDLFPTLPSATTAGTAYWYIGYGLHIEGTKSNVLKIGEVIAHRCGTGSNDSSLHGNDFGTVTAEFNGVGVSISRPGYQHTSGKIGSYYYEANTWQYLELSEYIANSSIEHTYFDTWDTVANIAYPKNTATSVPVAESRLHTTFPQLNLASQATYAYGQNSTWTLELGSPDKSEIAVRSNNPIISILYDKEIHRNFRYNMFKIHAQGFGSNKEVSGTLTINIHADSDAVTLEGYTTKVFSTADLSAGPVTIIGYLNFNSTTTDPSILFHIQ